MRFSKRKQNRRRQNAKTQMYRYVSMLVSALGSVVAVVSVAVAANWFSNSDNFPITTVNVEGNFAHVSPDEIRETVTPFAKRGFFKLDVEGIKNALRELPWVDVVVVRKLWPDTLWVHVQEQAVLARWGEEGLINQRGEVFYPAAETIDTRLPILRGPSAMEAMVGARYKTMAALLSDIGVAITEIRYDARGSWQMEFDGRQIIMLGRENVDQRLNRLATFYPGLLASRPGQTLLRVDMRYDNGIAVQWQNNALAHSANCQQESTCSKVSL